MRPGTARAGAVGRPKGRKTGPPWVTRSVVEGSCGSLGVAVGYGPVIASCEGVHGSKRSTTSAPVSSTGVTSTIAATRGHTLRHQDAASAPISNPMTRYQYTRSLVLSQFQDW